MSLINQVLRDLSARSHSNKPTVFEAKAHAEQNDISWWQHYSHFFWGTLLLFILIFLLLWTPRTSFLLHHKLAMQAHSPVKTTASMPEKLISAPHKPIASAPIFTPALLQSSFYSVNDTHDQTHIVLQFDKQIGQTFTTNFDPNSHVVTIQIGHAAVIDSDTLFKNLPMGLLAARASTENGEVNIALRLAPETTVRRIAEGQQGMQVLIDLNIAAEPAVSAASTVSAASNLPLIANTSAAPAQTATRDIVTGTEKMTTANQSMSIKQSSGGSVIDVEAVYQNALSLANSGQGFQAMTQLKQILSVAPNHRAARQVLASLQLEAGELDEAAQTLNMGLKMQPGYYPYAELEAHLLVARGKPEAALSMLQHNAPALDTAPDYYAFMAALAEKQGKITTAVALYRELLAENPSKAVWWMGLGIAYEHEQAPSLALSAYQRALALGSLNLDLNSYVSDRVAALQ